MYEDLHEPLVRHLNSCRYISVMADSSTDTSVRDLELVYVRHIKEGRPVNTYMATQELDHVNAQGHLDCIDDAVSDNGLPDWKDKLVGFGSDGASVMVGQVSGVVGLLKVEIPYLMDIHCLAHKLELGAMDAIKDQAAMKDVFDILNGIYKQYHYSPKAWRDLKTVADLMELEVLKPVNLKGTRWLPHLSRALSVLLKSYPVLVRHLEHTITDGKSSPTMIGRARQIVTQMKHFKSLQFMFFMCDVLDVLSCLSCKFQENKVTISECIEALETAFLSLRELRVEHGRHLRGFLAESVNGTFHDVELTAYNDASRNAFNGIKVRVLDSVHNHLDNRFSSLETEEAKACAKILAVKDWPREADQLPQFGNQAIDILIGHFRPVLLRNGCDVEVARYC